MHHSRHARKAAATSQRRGWKLVALRFSTCEAARLLTRWRRSSHSRQTQSKRWMEWFGRLECALLRQNGGVLGDSTSTSSYLPRALVHRKRGSRKETKCLKPWHLRDTRSKEGGVPVKVIGVQGAAEMVAVSNGSWSPRRVLLCWLGMVIDGWKRHHTHSLCSCREVQ